jgi:uncharacterized protein (DUF1015 family)
MTVLRPFRGLRPPPDVAPNLIAPPYDTVSEDEARAIAGPNPRSFLHVTRPEVDLDPGSDAHSDAAYKKARQNFDAFRERGWLVEEKSPAYYLYAQTWQGRTQTGLMALCRVDAYDKGEIKRHELTRPDKELDRVMHIEALDAQTGLVFLAYRDRKELKDAVAAAKGGRRLWQTTTSDGVTHALSVIDDPKVIETIAWAFQGEPTLYVADGHHRSAAASRVNANRKGAGSSGWFLAGLFPDSQLRVLAYNRLVKDLRGQDAAGFRQALEQSFDVAPSANPEPDRRGVVTMYLDHAWWSLTPKPGVVPDHPVRSLDAQVLQDRVLEPLLGISDPRTDTRIEFAGGVRGAKYLSDAVDEGRAAVAFHLFPTGMDQLFAVADANELMPPKSTWFEPKLRGGVLVHKIA